MGVAQIDSTEADIQIFLQSKVADIHESRDLSDAWLKDDEIQQLALYADGLFIEEGDPGATLHHMLRSAIIPRMPRRGTLPCYSGKSYREACLRITTVS